MEKEKETPPLKRTVIVLDHSPRFFTLSKQHIDFDSSGKKSKGKSSGTTGGPSSVFKSFWTCNIEAAVEYCRIVYDIFSTDYLIKVIVSDNDAHVLNSWSQEQQCIPQLLKAFAALRAPMEENEDESSIIPGLTSAVECLCEPQAHVQTLVACVSDALRQQESETSSSKSMTPLKFTDLNVVHVPLTGDTGKITEKTIKTSSSFSTTVFSYKATQLVSKLSTMAQKHFNLKSTTVTGIPMKEEQHSGSSANYDVEILPSKKEASATSKDTIHLKWCTPKTTAAPELQACIGCYRITPVEVNSRPTACLISFLLQGRQVMLEQPKKSGGKLVSHILASHGGEIFIHCLANYRTPMEDPPSISEGCGGRVTDYRINDFGEFMKANRLAPCSWNKKKTKSPLEKGLARLERCTRYWPMVISETVVGNLMQVIYRLQAMESRNDPLPISMAGIRGKGPKREEQYRQVWTELEHFLEAASKTSRMHEKVLECLRGASPSSSVTGSPRRETPTDEIEGVSQSRLSEASLSWQEIDKYHSMTEREKSDFNHGDTNNEHLFKRALSSPIPEQAQKKLRTDNQTMFHKQNGSKGENSASRSKRKNCQ
ncbi:Integrator complex subunit 13 [Acropora cervicornis]|uniref:Integrator complex subunit 13 n=1 Tax=Acropora cervicornis TaxID=6130 RepID=A0AAD9PVE8_ACRCE|nr:Integrator complex subunit 13 [Acropora cervicornis]